MRLFGHHVHFAYVLLGVTEFVGSACAFFAAKVGVDLFLEPNAISAAALFVWCLGYGVTVVLGMLAVGLYRPKQRLTIEGIVARQIVGLMIATLTLGAVDLIFEVEIPGRTWVAGSVLSLIVLALLRLAFERLVDEEALRRQVLVLGAGRRASSLLQLRRKSDQRAFRLVAFVPVEGDESVIDDSRVVRPDSSLLDYARKERVSQIVVAMDDRRQAFPIADLLECRFSGIEVVDLVSFLERETGRVKIDLVTPDWMIFSIGFTTNTLRDVVLRSMDLAIVVASSLISLPLALAVTAAILVTDGRPVLYRQTRVGLRGKEFTLLKFRSMVRDAEAESGAQWAKTGDSRVTSIGSVLRKYRLDEIPQLLNVLRGDMSLVGPRPERPEFVQQLQTSIPYYGERHCVRPGITGWAQMSYPYGSSLEDAHAKLTYDLYYIKHRSLIFNLVVLLLTAEVILWTKGAR